MISWFDVNFVQASMNWSYHESARQVWVWEQGFRTFHRNHVRITARLAPASMVEANRTRMTDARMTLREPRCIRAGPDNKPKYPND